MKPTYTVDEFLDALAHTLPGMSVELDPSPLAERHEFKLMGISDPEINDEGDWSHARLKKEIKKTLKRYYGRAR